MKKIYTLILSFALFSSISSQAQIQIGTTQLDSAVLATNLNTPWDLIYTSDTSLWFTERIGKVSRINLNTNAINLVLDIQDSVKQISEGGLLGMVILETTAVPKVFLVYNYQTPNNTYFERLVRFDYDPIQDTLINQWVLIDSIPAASYHNGSRLEIVNNQLYMTTGDAGNTSNSQNLNSLSGKVLRFELNGSIPSDNPIANSPIYSWGHRNSQGLFFANGFLYSSEHGPSTDDEINIIEKGRNYGWPNVKGFCTTSAEIKFCKDSNVVEPLIAWTPTIATSGICYYNHPAIPEWEGNILLTTLKDQRLKALKLNTTKDSIAGTADYFINRWGRLRDITTNPAGEVFIATNSSPQRIIKLYNPNFTSIMEVSGSEKQLKIYPNPAKNILIVEINSIQQDSFELTLFDIKGKIIQNISSFQQKIQLDTSKLKAGLYVVEIQNKAGIKMMEKVIVR